MFFGVCKHFSNHSGGFSDIFVDNLGSVGVLATESWTEKWGGEDWSSQAEILTGDGGSRENWLEAIDDRGGSRNQRV